jgi:hypothetical protein
MYAMASVSLDQEVMFIGKNANIIIIIHSLAGGSDGRLSRPEVLSFNGGNWREVGQLGNARYYAAATKIMVNTTVCD